MWSEICDLVPLTTGLDCCISHDIAEYERCANNCEMKGMVEAAESYRQCANNLRNKQSQLDQMGPIARWWHEERQCRRSIAAHNRVIKDCRRRLGI